MNRCKAVTKDGKRCENIAMPNEEFCKLHKQQNSTRTLVSIIGGALIGNIIMPGLGGALIGGIAGAATSSLSEQNKVNKNEDSNDSKY